MAAKKKYKKLTLAEKKQNKEIRDQLREKGILPPIKPKLNRKKFAKEVMNEYETWSGTLLDEFYLQKAIDCMTPYAGQKEITSEQIGVLKVIKMAIEYKKFCDELSAAGESKYTIGDLYEKVVKPIREL